MKSNMEANYLHVFQTNDPTPNLLVSAEATVNTALILLNEI